MKIDDLPPLRSVLEANNLAPTKALGQNFLLDLNLTARIARSAEPLDECNLIEVGPGPGGLTRALLQTRAASVLAIEKDTRTTAILDQIASTDEGQQKGFRVLYQDALELDLLNEVSAPRVIVANLPYNVATPLLVGWLRDLWREAGAYRSLSLMFQREVVDRITAQPGDKAYGRLAVLTALTVASAERQFDVPAQAFTPPPKVTSAIVRLDARADVPGPLPLFAQIERVTAAAFGQRRKMLRQSLKSLVPNAESFLDGLGIAPTARAEERAPEDFRKIAEALA
ncbi:MAG: 16S rRNA (adenine(1518)-N(6)/adenine(1519)-N(6))-dimethyltransferase RsmA [Alphaproteobacteria bacterium]